MIDNIEERFMRCAAWRWMPGMRVKFLMNDGGVVADRVLGSSAADDLNDGENPLYPWRYEKHVPVVTDPATIGCIMALIRDAWSDPLVRRAATGPEWDAFCIASMVSWAWMRYHDDVLAEATRVMLYALEAVPVIGGEE